MVNASRLAIEFNQMLPQDEIPETTEGYEGFYHLLGIESRCEEAKLSYINSRPQQRKNLRNAKE